MGGRGSVPWPEKLTSGPPASDTGPCEHQMSSRGPRLAVLREEEVEVSIGWLNGDHDFRDQAREMVEPGSLGVWTRSISELPVTWASLSQM